MMMIFRRIFVISTLMVLGTGEASFAQSGSLRVSANGISTTTSTSEITGRNFSARAGQSNEIVLPDGTAVVIGAGGGFSASRYTWDGQAGTAILRLRPGTYRISAGALGRTGNLTVMAGATQIDIGAATAVVSLDANQNVTVYMTVGKRVAVSAAGRCTRRLSRPGFATRVSAGGCPGRTARVSAAQLAEDRGNLRPARRVAAASSAANNRGLLAPAAEDNASATSSERDASTTEATARLVSTQPVTPDFSAANSATPNGTSGGTEVSGFALALAPGISVPGATVANVTSGTATSTDGRFNVEDIGLFPAPLPMNIPGDVAPSIFEAARAASFYFSNSDLQPVLHPGPDDITGDFSNRLEFAVTSNIVGFTLDAFEEEDTLTIGQARQLELQGISSAVRSLYIAAISPPNPDTYFLDLDLDALGLTEDTLLGSDLAVQYRPLPQGELQVETLFAPFNDKVAIGFFRSNDTAGVTIGDAPDLLDGFALYHITEAVNGGPDPTGQSEIFATGVVGDTSTAYLDFRVERYESTFGLFDLLQDNEVPWNGYLPKRALLPDVTRQPDTDPASRIVLNDTGLHFVYAPQATDDPLGKIAQVVQADMGFLGSGAGQRSTLSIAVGAVDRGVVQRTNDLLNPVSGLDYALDIQSLGTVRNNPAGVGSTLVSSPLIATAFGGYNENLSDGLDPIPGLAGYYVLASDPDGTPRSRFLPMNPNAPASEFQTARFLRATGQTDFGGTTTGDGPLPEFEPTDRNTSFDLTGYAAGLAEVQLASNALTIAPRGSVDSAPNFTAASDAATNRISASLQLGAPGGTASAIALGGFDAASENFSTYVDQSRFAARSEIGADGLGFALASSALVLGEPVDVAGQVNRPVVGLGSDTGTLVPDYRHVKWGVFLGDRIAEAGSDLREHLHIGSWVAGDSVDVSDYVDFTGTAVYSGHAIGNAFDGQSVYTAIGTYNHTWDFNGANSTGNVTMTFDGSTYTGSSSIKAGGGFESTDLAAPGRAGTLDGDFFGGPTDVGGVVAPDALGGQFDVSNTPGSSTYQATGTFAADRQ